MPLQGAKKAAETSSSMTFQQGENPFAKMVQQKKPMNLGTAAFEPSKK